MKLLRLFVPCLSLGFANCFSSVALSATGDVKDFSIHQHGLSVRALGMGDAFVAAVDDYSAIFYNPAALARIEKPQMNLSLFHAGADTKLPKFVDDIGRVSSSDDVAQMTSLLEENYGNHFSARLGLLNAYWARPKWAIAFLPVDLTIEMRVAQSVGPQLQMVARQDSTLAYGRGWNVSTSSGKLSLGATAKAIYRGYFNKSINAVELAFDSNLLRGEDAAEGLTFDADFGALYTPNLSKRGFFSFLQYMKPTFGLTVRNIADYGFTTNLRLIDKNSREPDRLQRRLDIGSMYELPDWWIWRTRLAADIRNIGHDNWTFGKGTHLGAEFLWKVKSWFQGGWRIGVNQGYFTAGFNGDFAIFRMDLVTYAQEVGTSSSPKATRIYMAKASLDF